MGRQGNFITNNLRRWRKSYRWLLIICFLIPMQSWSTEAALRVAFVYNFLKFIEWPELPADSLTLCILDSPPEMRQPLDQLATKTVNKHAIRVVYFADKESLFSQISHCQLIYWPGPSSRFPLHPLPTGVVLVTDEANAQEPGVSIVLQLNREGHIEFTINEVAVKQAGVSISSQLLKLAKNYRDGVQTIQGGKDG